MAPWALKRSPIGPRLAPYPGISDPRGCASATARLSSADPTASASASGAESLSLRSLAALTPDLRRSCSPRDVSKQTEATSPVSWDRWIDAAASSTQSKSRSPTVSRRCGEISGAYPLAGAARLLLPGPADRTESLAPRRSRRRAGALAVRLFPPPPRLPSNPDCDPWR